MNAYRSYHQRKSYAFLPGFLVRLEFLGGILSCRSPPFSTKDYEWFPANFRGSLTKCWRVPLLRTDISSRRSFKTPTRFMPQKVADSIFFTFYDVLLESQITCGAMKESNPGVPTIRVILIFRVTICLNSIFVGVTD